MNLFIDLDGTLIDSKLRLYHLFQYLVIDSELSFEEYWELKRNKIDHKEILSSKFNYTNKQYIIFLNKWMSEIELNSRLDQWLFFIKNLEDFQSIPSIFSDEIFTKAFEKAELAKFGQGDLDSYENSLKIYRDLKGVIDTAFDEGKQEGKEEGRIEIAKSLKENGVPIEIISKTTGLSKDQIDQL